MDVFHVFKILQMVPNRAKRLTYNHGRFEFNKWCTTFEGAVIDYPHTFRCSDVGKHKSLFRRTVRNTIWEMSLTAWKVSKYGVIYGPYFRVFGLEITLYLDTFHAVPDNSGLEY